MRGAEQRQGDEAAGTAMRSCAVRLQERRRRAEERQNGNGKKRGKKPAREKGQTQGAQSTAATKCSSRRHSGKSVQRKNAGWPRRRGFCEEQTCWQMQEQTRDCASPTKSAAACGRANPTGFRSIACAQLRLPAEFEGCWGILWSRKTSACKARVMGTKMTRAICSCAASCRSRGAMLRAMRR